jgi:diaminopimelate decarboxylase
MQFSNGRYTLGGVDALKLVEEFGAPLYVYDTNIIRRQYETLRAAFTDVPQPVPFKIKYACKALSNISIVRFIRSLGAGLDVVSLNEAHIGLRAGFQPHEIMYTPNCVSFAELQEAVALGVGINVDNLPILDKLGAAYGGSVPVCIRINPHIMAGGNLKISTGHADSKFGISIDQADEIERIVRARGITVAGIHQHTGSEVADPDVFLQAAEVVIGVARRFQDTLRYLDFGGGFKVAYKPDDTEVTNIGELGRRLVERVNAFSQELGHTGQDAIEIVVEPGKFLVSEAGMLLVRTNVIKQTPTRTFAGVDSGLNHLIRPMFYKSYHHITNISHPDGKPHLYSVCGYICETDNFAWDRELAEVREGDVLAFHNAGAYGFMMSSQYNSRPRPAEVMILNGTAHLIRKREGLEDMLRNQVEVEV